VHLIRGWRNYVVVVSLGDCRGQDEKPFPVYQLGESVLLVAEWREYTPSHGSMIRVGGQGSMESLGVSASVNSVRVLLLTEDSLHV
jgi:hypothetical protein